MSTEEVSAEDIFAEYSDEKPENKDAGGEELVEAGAASTAIVEEGSKELPNETPTEPTGDPLEGASDEVKALVVSLQDTNNLLTHKVKSGDGRVSALHKKLGKLEERGKQKALSVTDFANAFKSEGDWKQFSEDNPDFAAPMEKFLLGMAKTADKNLEVVTAEAQELTVMAGEDSERRTRDVIGAAHPDWLDVLADKEYTAWLSRQPTTVQAIMDDGTVEDSIALLDMFKEFKNLSSKAEKKPSNTVAELKEKRERQLQAGAQPPAKSGSVTPTSSTDSSDLFNYFANKAS